MSSVVEPDNKRRRRTSSSPDAMTMSLENLPHDHLTAIGDYLPNTSRALLAVALTAPSSSFREHNWQVELNNASKAIISSKPQDYWSCIDLMDVSHLSDNDARALLVSIDAKNNLKHLSLTHNWKLVGHCLEPLRGSVVLESITFDDKSELSLTTVIPILESIVDVEGNSFRRLELPNEWKKGKVRHESPLNDFLYKFTELILSEEVECAKCKEKMIHNPNDWPPRIDTCSTCFKFICNGCNEFEYPNILQRCNDCDLTFCEECGGGQHREPCNDCGETYCSLCQENEDANVALVCDSRARPWMNCQPCCIDCMNADNGCHECLGLHYPQLAARNQKLNKELQKKLDEELQKKHDDNHEKLAEENKQLREEIDRLRKKLASELGMSA